MNRINFNKILLLIVTLALLSGLCACKRSSKSIARNKDGKINVTVTIFPPYDFVRRIAEDRVNLTMLLPPGSDSHFFEPSSADINAIANSDMVIYSGGELDAWIQPILHSRNKSIIKKLSMKDMAGTGMEYDHVWTYPYNAVLIVQAIAGQLCEADPDNAEFFQDNADTYCAQIVMTDYAFYMLTEYAPRRIIVFADCFPFRCLSDAYGLGYYAAVPDCSAESEADAATVDFLIDTIRAEHIPVIFHTEMNNGQLADTISEATGAKKFLLHSCRSISKKDFDSGLGYLEIQQRNIENLREALH